MIGNLIGELKGKTTGVRVLPNGKTELTLQWSGMLWGVGVNAVVTYLSTMLPNGAFYGDGTGFMTTEDGELVTYRGAGIGWSTGPGWSSSFRGALYCQTASKKLAEGNKVVVRVYEHRSDANGDNQIKVWEWG